MELCWIPGQWDTQEFQETKSQVKRPKKHRDSKKKMIVCPYQDLFPYINDVIHQKWNNEWDKKKDKLKEIKPHRKDETVINRLRAVHTLLTHGCLMEGRPVPPECELCQSHTMTEASPNCLRQPR